MHKKQYCKLASWVLKARFPSKYRVSKTWVLLADLGFFCHIDLESYRLEFVKSKSESIGLDFYSETDQIRSRTEKQRTKNREQRSTSRRKKRKKKRRRGRRTEDQIEPEEEESDLERRRREQRKKKKQTCSWNLENGNSSFKYPIFMWIFFNIRLPSHAIRVLETRVQPLNSSFRVSRS